MSAPYADRGPRLNLHTHLEGSVRPSTAAELALGAGVPVPLGGWGRALEMRERGSLTVFLAHVAAVYPLLGSVEALERVGSEAVCDAAADGVDYLELRFGPATHARPGLALRDVVGAVCRGVAHGRATSGAAAGVVVCMLRHHDDGLNRAVAVEAAAWAGAGVVGLDVAGDELALPDLVRFAEPFRLAAAAGLGLTAHAAEAGPASCVLEAMDVLGVRRIGHGSHLVGDKAALRRVADAGVTLEVCPSSNVLTGAAPSLAEHPVRTFIEHGCAVVLGDDDPVTTGSRFSAEEAALTAGDELAGGVGLHPDQVRAIRAHSVEVAFCSDADRAALRDAQRACEASSLRRGANRATTTFSTTPTAE